MKPSLARELSRPDAYPFEPVRVQRLETHISWIFLTGRWAYKVKKPVRYSFLDFSTLEKRRHFCYREVALNRRLAPSLYLGVVPVTRDREGRHRVEGTGKPVEFAVKMRQLPERHKMDVLLARGRLKGKQVAQVACTLASFHRRAERVTDLSLGRAPHLKTLFNDLASVRAVFARELGQGEELDQAIHKSNAFLDRAGALLEKRLRGGFLRDGHGDVHTANVFLEEEPLIFDCVEFNDVFRYTDTAGDVGFMAMDLDARARPRFAEHFTEAYVEAARDRRILEVLPWYQAYRANVRAKVAALSLAHLPEGRQRVAKLEEAERYLALCHRYLDRLERAH